MRPILKSRHSKPRPLLGGENDHLNAIMTIKPGAGGTESQDWADMLLRMYLRWAENQGFPATILDLTPGEGRHQVRDGTGRRRKCFRYAIYAKAACIAWFGFRRSIRRRGGILRLRRCL